MAERSRSDLWDRRAYDEILRLLEKEHAVVRLEIEAKLSDRSLPGTPRGINPHHISNALRRLTASGKIREEVHGTRGGRHGERRIAVIVPTDQRNRKTKIEKAAMRKRLLQGRYLGWAEQSSRGVNVIGDAGEAVTLASLVAAGPIGIRVLGSRGGRISHLLGRPVDGGPLGAAAQLIVDDGDTPTVVTVPKNLRPWLYPRAPELYQLLDKAARLQIAFPNTLIMPLMVLRRAHFLTYTI